MNPGPAHTSPSRTHPMGAIAAGAALIGLLLLCAPLAGATPSEERQGERILNELEAGQLRCGDAAASDFELVGEYAMGRMFGSPARHEAMNQMMSRTMGSGGEASVHEAMGRRFSGCGGGQLPSGFGQMMGAVDAMGMMGGYGYESSANEDDDFDGPSAGAMIGMMGVLIGAVALALLLLARRRPGGPVETLERRYASGELSAEEYRERKRLLEGS